MYIVVGHHQYIKILTCVCVSVSDDVHGAGLDYSDARPSYFNLFTEPRTPRRLFENIGLESSWGCKRMQGAAVEADAIGEQQPKRTRSGAAAEADPSSEHAAVAEGGAIREQQLEADANGKQRMAIGPGSSS